MPQLPLYGDPIAQEISWTYKLNPLKPEQRPSLVCVVVDERRQVLDGGLIQAPHNVIHEIVAKGLRETWDAYLFGERGDVRKSLGVAMRWGAAESERREAAAQAYR